MAVTSEHGNYQLVGVDFNNPTFTMVGGMSIDDIKIKYNWFLNAEVEGAVIGEDKNGLVWYKGDWICGTWEGGTWYSGIFHGGRWKLGNWYSYDIDQNEMLKGNLYINRIDINKSQFLSGTWEGGTFNYGIFGQTQIPSATDIPYKVTLDFIINYNVDYLISGFTYTSGETYYYITSEISETDTGLTIYVPVTLSSPVFQGGDFLDGWMNIAKIKGGNFKNGFINNSCWYSGKFYNGYFLGDIWYNGDFLGGDFSNGIWLNGNLTCYQNEINTRFGVVYKDSGTTYYTGATWTYGKFTNGEFHSKLNIVEGVTYPSDDNSLVKWLDGIWYGGYWYGGVWYNGTWMNGTFYNGIILNMSWYKGHFENGFWKNGTMYDGTVSGGIFENITTVKGNFGSDI
jgi:hypothetical protein